MSTFVLIHGSWHGAWAWAKVAPLLEQAGHRAVAPDLPGHGQDRTPLSEITLERYVARVVEVLDAQPEPVILVGHSHGGVVITQAAEERPERIRTLVYLCAFLPRNGESLLALAQRDPDPSNNILPHLVMSEDQTYATVREDAVRTVFYEDCSDEDIAWASSKLVPEPLSSPMTPVQITAERFGRIPRVYIECLRDRAISPALQRQMYTATPCEKVASMGTSHSPFLSAPGELLSYLLALS